MKFRGSDNFRNFRFPPRAPHCLTTPLHAGTYKSVDRESRLRNWELTLLEISEASWMDSEYTWTPYGVSLCPIGEVPIFSLDRCDGTQLREKTDLPF